MGIHAENHHKLLLGLAALMRKALSGEDLSHLTNMAAYNPDDANMLMGLSIVFQLTGNREAGLELQWKALQLQQLYRLPSSSGRNGIRLLAIMRPGDMMDNTPVDFLLEGSDTTLDLLYVSPDLPFPPALPEHDVAIVAIGQTDQNQPLLEQVSELLKHSPCRVLNAPEQISRLSRDNVSRLLQNIPGLEIPLTARVSRLDLQQLCHGEQAVSSLLDDGCFPLIVRPLGSHGGSGLVKIDNPAALAEYLAAMPQDEFNIARFVDYRKPDGQYRKCRIALIDGQPYACHLAISDHWMIHYRSAGMEESPAKRAEEERFMTDFDSDFARRHRDAFHGIGERLGLDYLVMDCSETAEGKLLIFEADNLGFVHAMDPPDIFPYKQAQMRKVFDAFHAMLEKASLHGRQDTAKSY